VVRDFHYFRLLKSPLQMITMVPHSPKTSVCFTYLKSSYLFIFLLSPNMSSGTFPVWRQPGTYRYTLSYITVMLNKKVAYDEIAHIQSARPNFLSSPHIPSLPPIQHSTFPPLHLFQLTSKQFTLN
jgi:hypothetical protein